MKSGEEVALGLYLEGSREVGAVAQAALEVLHQSRTSAQTTIRLGHRLVSDSDPESDFI